MKCRILFAGNNENLISELFEHLSENYELMTSSLRYRDIDSHLNVFKPNIYVFCIANYDSESFKKHAEMRSYFAKEKVNVVAIGKPELCQTFQNDTANMANLVIEEPATVSEIIGALDEYAKNLSEESKTDVNEKRHVLVIDDDPQMLRVIKEMLHDSYDVATAINSKIAYKFLEKRSTDIILLDYEMPDENGLQVLTKLRSMEKTADIPVFFLTGNTDRDKIKQAMSLNPQGYLVKPIDKASLIDSIKGLIGL